MPAFDADDRPFSGIKVLDLTRVPARRVRTIPECLEEAQVTSREVIHTFSREAAGLPRDLRILFPPFRFLHGGPRADTDAVLQELGYDARAIRELRERGVI